MKNTNKPMHNYYVYETGKGVLKLSEHYVPHVLKIQASSLSAAKRALTNYKKQLKKDEE